MYELIHCKCGLIYGERPESYSGCNPHPHNYCPECERAVSLADVRVECVPESVWIHTPKHHYHPNWQK